MNKHLNNWLDKVEGLPENTTNNSFERELKRQGYKPKQYKDDKTGEPFIGWSIEETNKFKECDGRHKSVDEIINCESCSLMLEEK